MESTAILSILTAWYKIYNIVSFGNNYTKEDNVLWNNYSAHSHFSHFYAAILFFGELQNFSSTAQMLTQPKRTSSSEFVSKNEQYQGYEHKHEKGELADTCKSLYI